jgi:hypothetical protein
MTKYLAFSQILGSPSSYITLQPLPSEFPYTVHEENFILFFICVYYMYVCM